MRCAPAAWRRQLGEELGDRAEAAGCVVASPGLAPDVAALEIGDNPVPAVLDLMHPLRAGGPPARADAIHQHFDQVAQEGLPGELADLARRFARDRKEPPA
jgi:hypothetical protein